MASAEVRTAAGYSLLAAGLWASYYGFLLALHGSVSPIALTAYPFLVGGVAYGLFCASRGEGRVYLRLFRVAAQWGRIALFVGIQFSIIYITIVNGAVDSALLSLVGDVALTPLLVMLVYNEGRDRLRSAAFLGGLLLTGVGASLTIVSGGGLEGFSGWSLLIAPVLPLFIAVFFISCARDGRTTPVTAIAGQAALAAGLVVLPLTFVLPASLGALAIGSVSSGALLVGMGVTSFFLAPALYFLAIQRAGIFLPSLLMAGIPVFTLVFAATIGNQYPTPLGLIGIPIAVIGGVLAVRASQSATNPYQPA